MIEFAQVLEMKNVLSCRRKASQTELQTIGQSLDRLIKNVDARPTGPTVTATFSIDQTGAVPIFDMELLIPIDKEVCVPEGFEFKDHFLLTNALKIRHTGNPSTLQESVNKLNQYILEQKLTPITVGYNVTVKAPASLEELDQTVVDVYVGISPNKL